MTALLDGHFYKLASMCGTVVDDNQGRNSGGNSGGGSSKGSEQGGGSTGNMTITRAQSADHQIGDSVESYGSL